MLRSHTAGRLGAIVLVAAQLIYLAGETIAALAWKTPPYSYAFNYVSDLGVPGPPSEAFGQLVYSPLAGVMNAGFFLYGALSITATLLLVRPNGDIRGLVLGALGLCFGAGGILLALFPGSQFSIESGLIILHTLGALLAIAAGNVLSIAVAVFRRRLGVPLPLAVISLILGIVGLVFFVIFQFVARADGTQLIGLVERGAIYPFVATQLLFGVGLLLSSQRSRQPGARPQAVEQVRV